MKHVQSFFFIMIDSLVHFFYFASSISILFLLYYIMCTEFIQIIDSSIPKYHTSNLLTQTSQHHLKSYIAAAVGRQNKSMVNYNDNCNIKSSHTTGSKSLKPTNPSSTPESESIIHAKKESKGIAKDIHH
jgi:hypothetical protein